MRLNAQVTQRDERLYAENETPVAPVSATMILLRLGVRGLEDMGQGWLLCVGEYEVRLAMWFWGIIAALLLLKHPISLLAPARVTFAKGPFFWFRQ